MFSCKALNISAFLPVFHLVWTEGHTPVPPPPCIYSPFFSICPLGFGVPSHTNTYPPTLNFTDHPDPKGNLY